MQITREGTDKANDSTFRAYLSIFQSILYISNDRRDEKKSHSESFWIASVLDAVKDINDSLKSTAARLYQTRQAWTRSDVLKIINLLNFDTYYRHIIFIDMEKPIVYEGSARQVRVAAIRLEPAEIYDLFIGDPKTTYLWGLKNDERNCSASC